MFIRQIVINHCKLLSNKTSLLLSFCFLLWGLSAVASSINLLVLKFMTISLEEEEQGEDELHEMGANIITLDEQVIRGDSRPKGLYMNPLERDSLSVCSCTCYPVRRKARGETGAGGAGAGGLWARLLAGLGWAEDRDSNNYYDAETQSISNYAKLAVKRSSF